jgi:nucleotide-binding universal stress UspA family protein
MRYVVGVDGSSASKAALEWSLNRAAVDHHPVHLVHVIDDEAGVLGKDYEHEAERTGLRLLSAATQEARQFYPTVDITSTSVHGTVPWELSHAAAPHDVLAIGTHRETPFAGHVLGSRSVQIASITQANLAVVPTRRYSAAGPVVVGVGVREPAGPPVLRGAHEAARSGLPLVLVLSTGGFERLARPGLANAYLAEAERLAKENEASIEITTRVSPDDPSHALLNAAYEASLLVLGPSRTLGTNASPIGTVTQSVLLNARCPILITRYTDDA